jgi:predicted amidohydrolase YtcJ
MLMIKALMYTPLIAALALTRCAAAPAPPAALTVQACDLALTGARVWDGEEFRRRDLHIGEGHYLAPERASSCARTVALDGAYVSPPFAEGHSHNVEAEWSFPGLNARYLEEGVFYVLNPLNMPVPANALQGRLQAVETIDVNFAHGALTSYRGHPEFVYVVALSSILYGGAPREAFTGEAFHTIETPADVEPALDRLQAQGSDTVKLVLANSEDHEARSAYLRVDENWAAIVAASADDSLDATTRLAAVERTSVGLDPALTPRIVERIHARGMRAIAHIDTVTDFDLAVRAGVDTIVHMPGIALAPGNTLENGTLTDAAIARAAQRGIGVVLTASVRPDFTPEADRPALHAMQRSNIRRLMEAGVPVYIGTDRWQAMASEEVAYLIEIGAMSPAEAFAAWIATSQAVFPERRIGRIAPGYEADLLVFEADPRHSLDSMGAIARRMKGGTWISQD